MPQKRSAGLLLFQRGAEPARVLLGHMGGPFWARKDAGAWTIPKGEYTDDEQPFAAARREFAEELGVPAPRGTPIELGSIRQSGGKLVTVWAIEGDLDPSSVIPGTFEMEWPPRSGRTETFPELDRVAWFGLSDARDKLVKGQLPFLDRLGDQLVG